MSLEHPHRQHVSNLKEAALQVLAVKEEDSPGSPIEGEKHSYDRNPTFAEHADLGWLDSATWVERIARQALHNYATVYVIYLLSIVFLGSLVLCIGTDLSISASIFTACSAVTQAGLAVSDFAHASVLTHVVVFVLIIMGSPLLLTLAPVLLRRFAFRSLVRWCRETGRREPSSDEDGALKILFRLVIGFWFTTEIVGFLLLLNVDFTHVNGKPKAWNALFMTTSAFQNTGLALTPSSLEDVANNPYVLYVMSLLIILGNTGVPICMRVLAVGYIRWTREGSNRREHAAFLLKEPRRCYTHLFSPLNTLWLIVMLVNLLLFQIVIIAWLDWNNPELTKFEPQARFANVFFQAASTRTAGLNSIDLQKLSVPTVFVILVCMYISTSPIVVTMRATNVKVEEAEMHQTTTMKSQALTYMTQHGALLVVLHLAIMLLEHDKMVHASDTCDSMASCDLRARFSFFKVMFEIVSAYGTVGLSLGSTYVKNSFCEDWSVPSQLLLCGVMILGRTRDLPLSIDHAFKMHWDRPDHAEFFAETVKSYTQDSSRTLQLEFSSFLKEMTGESSLQHYLSAPLLQREQSASDQTSVIRDCSI